MEWHICVKADVPLILIEMNMFLQLRGLILVFIAGVTLVLGSCAHKLEKGTENVNSVTDSIALLTENIRQDSLNGNAFMLRAKMYLKNGNIDPALRDLNQALLLQPENPDLYILLSDVYLILGQTDNSLASLRKAVSLNPTGIKGYLKSAEAYMLVDNLKAANEAVDRAISLDRNNAESHYMKGIAMLMAGDTAQAKLSLQISTGLRESNFMSYIQLASIAVAQGDTLSEYYLHQALLDQPQDERALFFMAMVNHEKGDFDEAIKYFDQVIELYPENKRAYYHAGYICLAEVDDYKNAESYFTKAIELDSSYVEAVYNLGRTFEAKQEYKKARQQYKQSLQLLPNYPLAVQGMNRLDDQGLGL